MSLLTAEPHFGTRSTALLAHVAIGLTILFVTALIVPRIPLGELTPHPPARRYSPALMNGTPAGFNQLGSWPSAQAARLHSTGTMLAGERYKLTLNTTPDILGAKRGKSCTWCLPTRRGWLNVATCRPTP